MVASVQNINLDALINTKQTFLSCDWGTSSFRLRLVSVPQLQVLAEVSDNTGIASTYELWEKEKDGSDRLQFYQNIIKQNIEKLERKLDASLANVPLILSGMASSTIGMKDLPYKDLPFSLDGDDLLTDHLPDTELFPHHTIIVSGARAVDDVMRGEEIQLVGSAANEASRQVFIFPGTHSKHVYTNGKQAIDVKTYMTGELFHLLSTKSILATSLDADGSFDEQNNQQAFKHGVDKSLTDNPLHSFFLVRTNQLFQKFTKSENYFYLSGLLIGLELNSLRTEIPSGITLVSNKELSSLYQTALQQFGLAKNLKTVSAEEAILKGHYQIYLKHLHR